jgi:hypothetical protein
MDLEIVRLDPAKEILVKIGSIALGALKVALALLIGWVIAKAVKGIVTKILKVIKIDVLAERINLNNLLLKGGITATVSELMGIISYWIIILVTFLVAVNAVGLTQSAALLEKVVLYVPHVIAAIFILIIGMFFATLLNNAVKTAANNAGISQSPLLGKAVQIIVIAFTVAIALEQLKIATLTIHSTISIIIAVVLGSLGLGFALAFGLGCKDIVAKYVEDFIENIKSKK